MQTSQRGLKIQRTRKQELDQRLVKAQQVEARVFHAMVVVHADDDAMLVDGKEMGCWRCFEVEDGGSENRWWWYKVYV